MAEKKLELEAPTDLIKKVEDQAGASPVLPEGTKVDTRKMEAKDDEVVKGPGEISTDISTQYETGDMGNLEVQDPERFSAPYYRNSD